MHVAAVAVGLPDGRELLTLGARVREQPWSTLASPAAKTSIGLLARDAAPIEGLLERIQGCSARTPDRNSGGRSLEPEPESGTMNE